MKTPLPPIHETPEELKELLITAREARKHQRVQALYLLQTQQARTRRQVAPLLGVNRETVGRWLAAYGHGGIPQRLTIAKAPGKTPRLSEDAQRALRERLAHPQGIARYPALWQGLRQECGVPIAYTTGHKLVRYPLRAKLKGPRKSPLKKS
jgi:transposase